MGCTQTRVRVKSEAGFFADSGPARPPPAKRAEGPVQRRDTQPGPLTLAAFGGRWGVSSASPWPASSPFPSRPGSSVRGRTGRGRPGLGVAAGAQGTRLAPRPRTGRWRDPWLGAGRHERQGSLHVGKGPKPSSEDVRGAALPPPSGPTLAFVNKWCGLCCNGVSVFALRVGRTQPKKLVLGGFMKWVWRNLRLGSVSTGVKKHRRLRGHWFRRYLGPTIREQGGRVACSRSHPQSIRADSPPQPTGQLGDARPKVWGVPRWGDGEALAPVLSFWRGRPPLLS